MPDTGTYVDDLPDELKPSLPPEWEQVKDQFKDTFPHLDPEAMRGQYENARNLAVARRSIVPTTEDVNLYRGQQVAPFLSAVGEASQASDYNAAKERFSAGQAKDEDYGTIAKYEYRQQVAQKANEGVGGGILTGLAHIPALAGEAAMTGGIGAAAEGLGLLPRLGVKAATTPLMPSFYLPEAAQRAAQQGGSVAAPQNLAPALGMGAINNIILGSAGNWSKGIANPATRFLAGVGVGVGEMEAAKVAGGVLDQFLPDAYQTKTRFGVLGQLIRGEAGDALKESAVSAVQVAAFQALHGNPYEAKKTVEAFTANLNDSASNGLKPEAAAQRAAKTVEDAQPAQPEQAQNAPGSPQTAPTPEAAQPSPQVPQNPPAQAPEPKAGLMDVRAEIAKHGDDLGKASDAIRQQITDHLKGGGRVSLWLDGKEVPVAKVENGQVYDAKGQPWGMMPLAMGTPGTKTGVEFLPKSDAASVLPKGPFAHLSGDDIQSLAKTLGVKAKTPEALTDALMKKGMKRDAVQALSESTKPQGKSAPDRDLTPTPEAAQPAEPANPNSQQAGNLPESLSPERRHDLARRKAVEEMAPEEKDAAIAELRRQVGENETDTVTGFKAASTGKTRENATLAGVESARKGEPATYAAIDLANLGGLNKKFTETGADPHFRAFADIIRGELSPLGKVELMRHGGDEMSAVVRGVPKETVDAALERARLKAEEYSKANGLDKIPHGKKPDPGQPEKPPGVGIHYGTTDIRSGDDAKHAWQRANTLLEQRKLSREYGTPPPESRPLAPEGQAARTGEGAGAVAPEAGAGEPGAAAGAPEEGAAVDELAKAGLTPKEQHIVRERLAGRKLADIAGDKELGRVYTRERVRQMERAALDKLGIEGSLEDYLADAEADRLAERYAAGEELHGHFDPESGRWVEEKIRPGDRVNMADLSGQFDPETGKRLAKAAKPKLDAMSRADDAADALVNQYMKEAERAGGQLPAERQRFYDAEFRRIRSGVPGEAQAAQGEVASAGGEVPERGSQREAPVHGEAGGGLREGATAPGVPNQEPSGGPPAAPHAGGEAPAAGNPEAPGNKLSPFHRAWEKQAIAAGHDPAELHATAKQFLDQNRAQFDPQRNDSIDEAWRLLKQFGVTPQKLRAVEKKGGDPAELPGMDDVAKSLGLGDENTRGDSELAAMLLEGKKQPLKPTDAYQHALDELNDRREARRATEEAGRSGFSAQAAEEALRAGQEDGEAEGAGGAGDAAGGDADDAFGGSGDFDFGANAGDGPHRDANGRPFAMGAAAAGELTPPQPVPEGKRVVALANASIDAQRLADGLNPIIESMRSEDAAVWDKAMGRLAQDPEAGKKLADELASKPRATTDVENALLIHQRVAAANEFRRLEKESQAPSGDGIDAQQAQDRLTQAIQDLYTADEAAKRSGSEWGKAGRWRQMLLREDFSREGLLSQARAAKGENLTPEEIKKAGELSQKIQEASDARDQAVKDFVAKTEPLGLNEKPAEAAIRVATSEVTQAMNKAVAATREAQAQAKGFVGDLKQSNRPLGRKIGDLLLAWQRASLLSGVKTLGKIGSASLETLAVNPAKEAAGAAWGWIPGISRIAEKAALEGGFSGAAEKRSFLSYFTQGIADGYAKATRGRSELESRFGKGGSPGMEALYNEGARSPLDLPQDIHAAIKAPALRAAYERLSVKGLEAELEAGNSLTPALLEKVGAQAFLKAHEAIFMEKNAVADAVSRVIEGWRNPKNSGGTQAVGLVAKSLLPIVKVPTNVVKQSLEAAFGLIPGLGRAAAVPFTGGIENLSPARADSVMRQLKIGSVGGAMFLLGAFNPKNFGGFYTTPQDEKKRKASGDVPVGAARVGAVTLPSWSQHNPVLLAGQIGASFRRTLDKTYRGQQESAVDALAASVVGMLKETPLLEEPGRLVESASTPAGRGRILGQYLSGFAVPRIVQEAAQVTDKVDSRKAEGAVQTIQKGIPGLRERLPAGK